MFLKYLTPDRRRRKRQLLNTSVRVFNDNHWIDAVGINISDMGMGLFAVANLPIDSQLLIEFPAKGRSQRVRLSGVVRNRALYLYGIEFIEELDEPTAPQPDQHAYTR
ncbi:MAG TPA: PilZ domain-containing protein [Terriglobales bacterium]|nr:PilZ domain-containing protein [Terriglobales bacterium]